MKKLFTLILTLQLIFNGEIILDKTETTFCEHAENIPASFRYLLGHILTSVLGGLLADRLAENTHETNTAISHATCRIYTEIQIGDITVASEADDIVGGRDVIPIYAVGERSICLSVHKVFRALSHKAEVS